MALGQIMESDGWPRVEVRHLAALRAVAQEGSFGAAATRLGYTQSAVSQQIATLERAVGERLVERPGGPRRVSLTEAGRVLLRHAERVVAGMEAAWAGLRALASGETGTLRVGTHQSAGARIPPELMRRFVAERPGVEVLLTESGSDRRLLDLLECGDLDLTFTVLPVEDGPFEAVELMRDPDVILAAGSPLATAGRAPALADLSGVPVIGHRHCISGERIERLVRRSGVERNVVFRSDDNGTVQGLVGAGMAAALVPLLATEPSDDQVVVLHPADELPPRRLALAWHRDRALTPAARALLDSAAALCGELAPAAPTASGAVGTIAPR